MDISLITSQSLRSLLSLTEKKDELIKGLEEIHAEIARTLKGGAVSFIEVVTATKPAPVAPAKAARTAPKAKARRSGGLKARILALLDVAGSGGLRVKEIAEKLGVRPTNISVWFSTTGKKITSKIESGRYAAKGASASRSPAAAKLARHADPKKQSKPQRKAR